MNPYQKLMARKRKWTPVQTTAGKLAEGAEETIYRALAIRHMEPLGENSNKYLDKKFWLDSSDRLMYEGKAPELSATRAARMPAFFEHANQNLPQYA
jgi:hypothetical protein